LDGRQENCILSVDMSFFVKKVLNFLIKIIIREKNLRRLNKNKEERFIYKN
jgi:hypothetical protein